MGWWKIDVVTGQSIPDQPSLASSPDVIVLNAIPGTDDSPLASYLGDVSGDFASDLAGQLCTLPTLQPLTESELRELLLLAIAPANWTDELAGQAFDFVEAFWKDLDSVYQDDWERPANEAERRWTAEYVVQGYQRRLSAPPAKPATTSQVAKKIPPIQFPIGSRVWAWWNAPQDDYYVGTVVEPGWIVRDADGRLKEEVFYIVQFDDGDELDVPPERIFALELPIGLQVEVRAPGENRYLPAIVQGVTEAGVIVRAADDREVIAPFAALRIEGRLLPKSTT
jgi:hypothetical protein